MSRRNIILILLVLIVFLFGLSGYFLLSLRDPGPDTGVATPPQSFTYFKIGFEDNERQIPNLGSAGKVEGNGIGGNFREMPGANGIVFSNGNVTNSGGQQCAYKNPRLVRRGSAKIAFVGPAARDDGQGNVTTDDMPAADATALLGDWFITDDGSLPDNEGACKLRITFEHAVKSFRFDVIDMDNAESIRIRFKDANGRDLKDVRGSTTAGDRTFDGRPFRENGVNPFSYVAAGEADLREVVIIPAGGGVGTGEIIGRGYGLAYDNFEINYAQDPPQTLTCYRCTAALTDANACESQTVTGTTCPAGWTTNSQCNIGQPSNMCPVQPPAEDGEMVVTKTGSETCGSNEESIITYSIVARNTGTTPITIDYVEDTFDTDLQAAGIVPSQLTPAFAVVTGNKIRWTGTVADRTFTAGQSKTYSYRMIIPKAQIPNFTSVDNVVVVSYNDETVEDEVNVPVDCEEDEPPIDTPVTETPELPNTGILDDGSAYIVFGLLLLVTGGFVYKNKLGANYLQSVAGNMVQKSPFARYEDKVDSEFRREKN